LEIGTKNLSPMITNRKFFIFLGISFVIYFISDYFFPDAMLYITGGIIGGTVKELFKQRGNSLFIWVWLIMLLGFLFLFYRLQNKILKYISLFIITIFLYVVDFILIEIIKLEVVDLFTSNINIAMRVISKALVLATIIYFSQKQKLNKEATHSSLPKKS